ncbi:DUF6531 domain-containing protein [Micromonospora sp. NPDC049523]|uniref:DUF6531 domain-containing protein n=1 Tax=Micromonospora sp. NPDC049523 TaxID=3155921 RepID=UPI0034438C0D
MTRPGTAEWSVLQLDSDPVPGDPESFEEITRAYQELARTTQEAHDLLASGSQVDVGQGKAMEAFRDLIGKLPGRLDTMAHSYGQAADAYLRYLPSLQEAQAMSLRALEDARQASQDQGSSQVALAAAQAVMIALGGNPDAEAAAKDTATDDVNAARNRQAQADQALDQAKALLGQATALRDQAARTAAQVIRQLAKDAPQRSLWEKIAEAFQAFVDFLRSTVIEWITTVLDVLSAIASFIFPPLGSAIGFLSGAIDFASALAGGNAGEIAMAAGGIALGLVPGGRLVGRVMKFAAKGGKLLPGTVSDGIRAGSKSLGDGGRQIGGALPGRAGTGVGANRPPVPKDTSVSVDIRECVTDPVDVATGEMVLAQTDLELTAPLALAIGRTHVSSYRAGGWFGPSWASTLDQRLEFDGEGVCYFAPDGMILVYPPAPAGEPVLPVEGPRWPLTVGDDGSARLTDPLLERTTHFSLSGPVGLISAVTDGDGGRLEVVRDDDGRPTMLTHPSGQRIALTTEADRITAMHLVDSTGRPAALVTGYGYDDRQRLIEVVNASGQPMRFGYDDHGRVTDWRDRNGVGYHYTYDEDGRCVRTEGDSGYLSASLAYDPLRRLTVYTDSLGDSTTYQLDGAGHLSSRTDPLGNTTRYVWGRYNQLLSRTDPLGRTTRYDYDGDGRLTAVVRPDGSTVRTTLDGGAMTISVRAGARTFTRRYDGAPDPANEQLGIAGLFDYDSLRSEDRVRPDAAVAGRQVARPGRHGGSEQVRYDNEGNPVERVDGDGHLSRTEYGPFGLVLATVDATGARTGYEYDTELRLTRVTNPLGLTWSYAYDRCGRVVEETDFNGRVLRFEYDAAGQLVRSTNGLGEVTEYEHDPLGNVVERRCLSGTTAYTYDPVGRLVRAVNEDAIMVIQRDDLGRVTASTTNGRTLSFRYDDTDRSRHRLTPSGADSVWSYDPFGNVASLVTAGHRVGFRQDASGRELRRTVDGRVVLEQSYGEDRRLAAQVVPGRRQRRFDYRADGQLTGIDDNRTGRTDFALDPVGRVLGVRGPGRAEDYRYDAGGQLTTSALAGAHHSGELRYHGNLVTEAGAVRYRYDRQGRMITRTVSDPVAGEQSWHFLWEGQDRLVGVLTPSGDRWRYLYDPLGRRIGKRRYSAAEAQDPASLRFPIDPRLLVEQVDFVWDGPLLVEQIHTDPRGRVRVTTWDHHPDRQHPVGQSVRTGQDQVDRRFYAIVTDLVGTPTDLVGTDGELAWQGGGTLWGGPSGGAGDAEAMMPLRFPGQYLDPETGLHYNVYRYYDPATGRYVSQDPLGLAPAPDPAGYVRNPYSGADPLGLAPKPSCTAGAASSAPVTPGGGSDAAHLDGVGSSGSRPASPEPVDAPVQGPANHPAITDSVQGMGQQRPGYVYHGSSEPPEVVFAQGLKSRAEQAGTVPHYNIKQHMHNGKGSGFVSTTGDLQVAMQFVRSDGTKVSAGGKEFYRREGWIYAIDPSKDQYIHLPSQRIPGMSHLDYQDEYAALDHISPDRIVQATKVDGYYNVDAFEVPDPANPGEKIKQIKIDTPSSSKYGLKMSGVEGPGAPKRG